MSINSMHDAFSSNDFAVVEGPEALDEAASHGAAHVFRRGGRISLADVMRRIEAGPAALRRRDTLSALRVVTDRIGRDPQDIPATATAVRALFDEHGPARFGVNERRFANIRALVIAAVEEHGMKRQRLTEAKPLSAEWAALMARLERKEDRHALMRLFSYCSSVGIAPQEVTKETLVGLHAALEAESFIKNPRGIIKSTIARSNMAGRSLPDWPIPVLSSPFKGEAFMMPLEAFPESFQADVERWTTYVSRPDPLDRHAPVRAMKPATLKSAGYHIRRFASSLVRSEIVPVEEITSLGVFFEISRFRDGLRAFLHQEEGKSAQDAARIAGTLISIARGYLRVDSDTLAELQHVKRRLDSQVKPGMGERHRVCLEQFEEPANVRLLLAFPEAEAARARRKPDPQRRARGMERALAASLLIYTCLRIGNLRTVRLDRSLRRAGGETSLRVAGEEVKNGADLAFLLPPDAVALLDEFVRDHRSYLPGSQGPYLFPGADGGPKSESGLRDRLCEGVRKHTGLVVNPHAFRHIISKIIVERDPSLYAAAPRNLGHRSIDTTLNHYLGTQSRAASRQFHQILEEARSATPGKEA